MRTSKIFFLKLILFAVVLFLADTIIGSILEHFYHKAPYSYTYRANYIVNKTHEDLLLFGSSRAAHHYDSSILEDSLNITVYNCGFNGASIYYHYALFRKIEERYYPKMILLDVQQADYIISDQFNFESLNDLFPYYRTNKYVDDLFMQMGNNEKIKLTSKLFRYNSMLSEIVADNLIKRDQTWRNGYIPIDGITAGEPVEIENPTASVDSSKVLYLRKFIELTIENNIKLFLCISPTYTKIDENLVSFTKELAKEYDVELLDYHSDQIFSNRFFKDAYHLNDEGARSFSSQVASELKRKINCN